MKTRNRKNPRVRIVGYVTADVGAGIESAAMAQGLSVGQFLDRLWLASHIISSAEPTPEVPSRVDSDASGNIS